SVRSFAMMPRFSTCMARTPPSPRSPMFDSWTMSFCISTRSTAARSTGSERSAIVVPIARPGRGVSRPPVCLTLPAAGCYRQGHLMHWPPTPDDFTRLLDTLRWVVEHSPYYRRLLDDAGVRPADVRTYDDFRRRVPPTAKTDLVENQRAHPPFPGF